MSSNEDYLRGVIVETLKGTIYSSIPPEKIIADLPKGSMNAAQLSSAILISAARVSQ